MEEHEGASTLDDAQPTRWPAMIQELVRHYAALWHESDTGLPWLRPPYTSAAQRANEQRLDHFLAAVSAELTGATQTEPEQQALCAHQSGLQERRQLSAGG
jgi:hypothetical protein